MKERGRKRERGRREGGIRKEKMWRGREKEEGRKRIKNIERKVVPFFQFTAM